MKTARTGDMSRDSAKTPDANRIPHGSRRTIFSLASVLLISGIAMIVFRKGEEEEHARSRTDFPPDAFPRWTDEELAQDEVLLTSFERGGLSVWGGGARKHDFATGGEYSFLVAFRPDDVSHAGLICRRGTLPDLSRHERLLIDAKAREAPFPVRLTLLAMDGEKPRQFTFPELTIPLAGTTLEFDLDSVPPSVPRSRIQLLSLAPSTRPRRDLSAYFDELRLSRGAGPVARRDTSRPEPLVLGDGHNFIPDGQFDAGLALWTFRRTPKGPWTLSASVDAEAPGGRTLGIHFLERGRVELVTPELSLHPGRYYFRMTLKGWKDLVWDADLLVTTDGRGWTSLRAGGDNPGTTGGKWETVEREFVVPGRREGDGPAYELRLTFEGLGDLRLDAVELGSLDGAPPGTDFLAVYSPDETDTGDAVPVWRWDPQQRVLKETRTAAVFPVFYLEEDFLLDAAARSFREGCRSIGLSSAVNLGAYLDVGDLALARERAQRRARSAEVGAWLLTPRANWSVAGVPPALARQASEVLAGEDRRLTVIGLAAEGDGEVDRFRMRTYRHTADALVVARGAGHGADVAMLKAYDTALASASSLPDTPYLAFVEPGRSEKALRLQFYLALIHRAAGIVLDGGSTPGIEPISWDSLGRLRDEIAALAAEIAAGAELDVGSGEPELRLRALETAGKRFLLAANPGPREHRSVRVRVAGTALTVSLGPWESKRVPIGKSIGK